MMVHDRVDAESDCRERFRCPLDTRHRWSRRRRRLSMQLAAIERLARMEWLWRCRAVAWRKSRTCFTTTGRTTTRNDKRFVTIDTKLEKMETKHAAAAISKTEER